MVHSFYVKYSKWFIYNYEKTIIFTSLEYRRAFSFFMHILKVLSIYGGENMGFGGCGYGGYGYGGGGCGFGSGFALIIVLFILLIIIGASCFGGFGGGC